MIPILERRDEFEEYVKVAAPHYKTAIKALDKTQTIKIAEEQGIPCPRTFLFENIGDLREVAKNFKYPVVIKPKTKVVWIKERAITLKVTNKNYAYNFNDLIEKYAKITSQFNGFDIPPDLFLIQEFVEGDGYGVEVLMYNSELKALFMHKRLREYPISGGASTLRVSVRNEKLKNYAVDLLKAMGWEGVAMVEFKLDEKSGDVWFIEVNGRFWGSLQLAISSGVDFPYLLYKSLMDGNAESYDSYVEGVMQKWLIPGDLLWFFASLMDNKRSKISTFASFLSSFKTPDDIVSSNDVSPTAGALFETAKDFLDVIRGNRTMFGELG